MLLKNRYSIILTIKLFLTVPGALYAQVDFKSSDVPIVVIETNGQEIPDDPRIVADMGIVDNGQGNRNQRTDPFNAYQGKISIELRGSTSQDFPKKQYAIETQIASGLGYVAVDMLIDEEKGPLVEGWILKG